ncbi:MAG TPA: xylulokinase [Anaerolineae bacterium]|nr:xylulokinase [Anaerolineae bacterium]HIQ04072.1 xylulokinase [Anaerolineae bacterium]
MPQCHYILAHDLGTTGNKASLFDAEGRLIASAFAGYETAYPQPGWAEQDPNAWWQAVQEATRQLIADSGVTPQEIVAIGFSGQMMGCVPVDVDGKPLRAAIIWADQRATVEAEALAQAVGADVVYRRTGHRPSPPYTLPKILWLRKHHPDIYQQTYKFLQPKDFIIQRLTSEFVTDYSDASGTNAFDLDSRRWAEDILDAMGVAVDLLPPAYPSTMVAGRVTTTAAEATGLALGTPVVIGGGDGACATVGSGAIAPGDAYIYLGSSSWIALTTEEPLYDPEQRTFTFCHLHPDLYFPVGTMQAAGGSRDWLLRFLGDPPGLEEAIAEMLPAGTGLLFLPYLMGERSPWWNPHARGALVGLAMSHGPAEVLRAVLEGVGISLRLILDALLSQGIEIEGIRFIGGGARSETWRQILADALEQPVFIPDLLAEATSWGAAVAAGVAVGLYPGWEIAKERTRIIETIEPDPKASARYAELRALLVDAYHALEPIFERLIALADQEESEA